MPTPSPTIRPARDTDAAAIARLAGELGYPVEPKRMAARLAQMAQATEQPAVVLVAERDGAVVGWVHVVVPADLVLDATADIWGLVVAQSARGGGIGRALMTAAEAWAAARGCHEVRLRSGAHRTEAHAFYERLGYRMTKTQLTFARSLGDRR